MSGDKDTVKSQFNSSVHAEPVDCVQEPEPFLPEGFRIGVIGDSLATGHPLGASGYFKFLDEALSSKGWTDISFVNYSKMGASSIYAGSVVDNLIGSHALPEVVVIALGGNDIQYEVPADEVKNNLVGVIERLQQEDVIVVLSGMKAPAYLDEEYRQAFDAIFTDLAEEYSLILDPLILEPLIKNPEGQSYREIFASELMADAVHPNSRGASLIAEDLSDEIIQALYTFMEASEGAEINSTEPKNCTLSRGAAPPY